MALGVGADVTFLEGPPGRPVSLADVREALKKQRYDVVTMAHGETSCGVRMVEMPEICRLAKMQGALTIVDAVVTLTAMPVHMDEWGIDVGVVGGQKALSSIPGVSACARSRRTRGSVVEERPLPRPHWCYDATRAQRFWGYQQYHYTAPVPGVLALHEALRLRLRGDARAAVPSPRDELSGPAGGHRGHGARACSRRRTCASTA